MRTKYALLFTTLALGLVGGTCQPKDKIYRNFPPFEPDADILALRSSKYEQGGPGWWSWLPRNTFLDVMCGISGHEAVNYIANYKHADNVLGLTREDTLLTEPAGCTPWTEGCEFVWTDEELCDRQGLPWVDISAPLHPGDGCTVRRASPGRLDQHTYVDVAIRLDPDHAMNTCATDCLLDFCWAQFVRP